MPHPKVGIIIPAWNEEKVIARAIESACGQNYPNLTVVVAVDNCTDNTWDISYQLQSTYSNLQVFRTENNQSRKAGALNQGIYLFLMGCDYCLILDADTIAAPDLVSEAIRIMETHPHLGAICARTHLTPLPTNYTLSQAIWWELQKLEYATADSRRVESPENFQILAGSCVLYRLAAIISVANRRGNGQFYDEHSLIEDYELTITLKECGWKVTIGLNMNSWTDVPLSFKVQWQQRLRWARSHVDTLRQKGWTDITWTDIIGHLSFALFLTQQLAFVILLIYLLAADATIIWNPLLWLVLGLFWFDRMYRLKYVHKLNAVDILVRALYLPEELYGLLHSIQRLVAYWTSFTKAKEEWLET